MCGLFAQLGSDELGRNPDAVRRILDAMRHRGPDGEGIHIDHSAGVVLCHRRLAVIDPEHGQQPMSSVDGELTIVFNGAIYNYLELRRSLVARGHPIRSYSDTEVLIYAYREWGDACVQRLVGMFAFAIWDQRQRRLFCARDRVGIKPLYYRFDGNSLSLASEIKALYAAGVVAPELDADGLRDYLTFQFYLGGKSLFKGVRELCPGYLISATLEAGLIDVVVRQYWEVSYDIDDEHDEAWFIDNLGGLIEDATRIHLRADVPLGAHLSGGLDSSALVCLTSQLLKGERIKTFTGAFREGPSFDETNYAKLVAAFADTDYREKYIDGSDLSKVLPRLIYYLDEPLAGPGMIPQYYVSRFAAEHVKVVLGGQGGDELFIGYARYLVAYLEMCLAGAIFETGHRSRYAVTLESIIPNLPLLQNYKPMLQGFWRDGLFDAPDRRYFKLVNRSDGMSRVFAPEILEGGYSPFDSFATIFNREGLHSLVNRMTYFDLKGSLPALLHVEDRTSMAASIESRVPLLDHRIVEFMARIPPNIKVSGGRMKHLFKEAVRNTVPAAIIDRKDKMGFPTPFVQWATGVAQEFVWDTLLSDRARQRGIYDSAAVEQALNDEKEFGRVIWGVLCLELWHRIFLDGDLSPEEFGGG
jgi:asparagine synthase (glutamine-hydrolysing)